MPKASPALVTFDAGLLSPLLGARIDLAKYPNGCSDLRNFIPKVQGPLVRRAGLRYVEGTKFPWHRAWLVRFQVSETISYMMEFGHFYIRFYANHGQLIEGGAPVEVVTPYSWLDLTAPDGTFRLRVAQSADVMYLFHRNYSPRKLLRTGATTFSLETAMFTGGPFETVNADKGVTVSASAQTGAVTLTANVARFNAAHVGGLFYLESKDFSAVKPWEVQKPMTVGELRRVDSRVYQCTAVGTVTNPDRPDTYTGSKTPTHVEGRAWDGDGLDVTGDGDLGPIGVEWEYLHSGYGIVRITGFTSSTVVTGEVISMLPADVVSGTTHKWADPMFWDAQGWPEHGVFWRERLVLARDRKIAMSVTADFENFAAKDPDEVKADSAITQTLNAKQINRILWMVEADDLIIGTNGDEWVIGPIQNNQAVGPTNIRAAKRTIYGSKSIQPAEVGGRVLFVQASGRKLRDYQYDYTQDNYQSTDTTKLADQISVGRRVETYSDGASSMTAVMAGVLDLTYCQEPDSVLWAVRADGVLIGLTFDREAERSDVAGWHPHPLTNGIVEAVESMPSPDGTYDDLWLIVRREINGQVVRYVEYLERPLPYEDTSVSSAEAFYVDCGLTYRGPTTEAVTGLTHLEGQVVDILVNGATHPQRTVSGGVVALQNPGTIIHVGLPAPCAMQTMRLEAGAADGTAQGKTKRITNVVLRFLRSLGGKVGPGGQGEQLAEIELREPLDPMDQAVPLLSGDTQPIPWEGGYETAGMIRYENDQPLPVALLGIFPSIQTQDAR